MFFLLTLIAFSICTLHEHVVFPSATFLIYIISTQLCYHSKEKQLWIFYNNVRVPSSGSSSIIMYESLGLESFE